jgi:hypothetical protein
VYTFFQNLYKNLIEPLIENSCVYLIITESKIEYSRIEYVKYQIEIILIQEQYNTKEFKKENMRVLNKQINQINVLLILIISQFYYRYSHISIIYKY